LVKVPGQFVGLTESATAAQGEEEDLGPRDWPDTGQVELFAEDGRQTMPGGGRCTCEDREQVGRVEVDERPKAREQGGENLAVEIESLAPAARLLSHGQPISAATRVAGGVD
jgi:hypothetical protein